MPRKSADTKRRIIEAAYRLFYKDGFVRVSLDDIARAAGITKRSFYYHFDSKQALIGAVLEHQQGLSVSLFEGWTGGAASSPIAVVEKLFGGLASWTRTARWRGSGFTRAAIELAAYPGHPGRRVARTHKANVEAWLAKVFEHQGVVQAQSLARRIVLLLEGCHVLILIHGDLDYARAAADTARLLVQMATTNPGHRIA